MKVLEARKGAPAQGSYVASLYAGGRERIARKVLYETAGHVSYARLSPRADRIAFMDHTFPADDAGTVINPAPETVLTAGTEIVLIGTDAMV